MSQIVCVQAEAGLTVLYSSAVPANEMLVGGGGGGGGGDPVHSTVLSIPSMESGGGVRFEILLDIFCNEFTC